MYGTVKRNSKFYGCMIFDIASLCVFVMVSAGSRLQFPGYWIVSLLFLGCGVFVAYSNNFFCSVNWGP
jgi:hypothetical protein